MTIGLRVTDEEVRRLATGDPRHLDPLLVAMAQELLSRRAVAEQAFEEWRKPENIAERIKGYSVESAERPVFAWTGLSGLPDDAAKGEWFTDPSGKLRQAMEDLPKGSVPWLEEEGFGAWRGPGHDEQALFAARSLYAIAHSEPIGGKVQAISKMQVLLNEIIDAHAMTSFPPLETRIEMVAKALCLQEGMDPNTMVHRGIPLTVRGNRAYAARALTDAVPYWHLRADEARAAVEAMAPSSKHVVLP